MTLPRTNSLKKKLDTIQESMYDSIGSFYITDKQTIILCCNQTLLKWMNLSCASNVIGKTTRETPWAKHTDQFHENNQLVMKENKSLSFFEYTEDGDNTLQLLITQKKPFYHNNELIGVCGRSLEVPLETLTQSAAFTNKTVFIDIQRKKTLTINACRKRTLFFLLKGYSAKQIAKELSLSKRTVEHHLEFIKHENEYTSLKTILLHVRAI